MTKEEKLIQAVEQGKIKSEQDLANFELKEELLEEVDKKIAEIPDMETILESVRGKKGEKGDKGDPGEKGEDGRDGADGRDGEDGAPGKPGKDGRDGRDGRDGVDGEPGKDGNDGRDGVDGKDGKDATVDLQPIKKKLAEIERIAQASALPVTTTHFYQDGVHKGRAKNINFIEGDGTSLDVQVVGDAAQITVNSTGEAAVTSVNGQTGDVSLGIEDLDDVTLTNLATADILVWNGSAWVNQAEGGGTGDTWVQDDLTDDVDGIVDTFTLTQTPAVGSPFMVFLSGTRQRSTLFTITGTSLEFTFVPPAGTELLIDYIQA